MIFGMVSQRVSEILCGYEDANDCNQLWCDSACLILLTNFENVCKNQLLRHITGTFEEMMTVLGKIVAYNNKLSTLELLTLDFPSYKQIFLKNILKIPIKSVSLQH